jgi:hypothetical protein
MALKKLMKTKVGRLRKHGSKKKVAGSSGHARGGGLSIGKFSLPPILMKGARPVEGITGILSGFGRAIQQAKRYGEPFRMTVVVDSYSTQPKIVVERLITPARDALDAAVAAAKTRGTVRVADLLSGDDMLTADAFAEEIGATRETVHNKRRRHEVLGLEGPKRGVRFPKWQLSQSGELLPSLPRLFDALGGHPWTVYRFLVQDHAEFGGCSALEAIREGRIDEVIAVAEAISSGSFA